MLSGGVASDAALLALPKAELHVHLDGSLRPGTLAELAKERGKPLPVYDRLALGSHMLVADARNLEDYLERFALTLSVMQDPTAIERIAYELAEDHAAENVQYLEARFCPVLNTEGGLRSHEALEATLRGMGRAQRDHGIRCRTIVCALRTLAPAVSEEMAELAVAYADRDVCAFDLAGAEAGFPAREHQAAFDRAHRGGLAVTVHAGEGYGPDSLKQAVVDAKADRIGHGTRLWEDPALLAQVRDRGIPLEMCVTSNVQTRVAPRFEDHPFRRYYEEGLTVTLCTDNRLMSGVTLTEEYVRVRDHLGLGLTDLTRIARMGFESAFVDPAEKRSLLAGFDAATVV